MDFSGKTALVTGSSRNIGRAIAIGMAERGADVGITARSNIDGCEETAQQVEATGSDAAVALADLADPTDIEEMVTYVREELGPIDILVNNATYRPIKPFLDVELEDIDRVQDVNFRGLFLTTQHVVPDMLDNAGGAIVNLIGAMVYLGRPSHTHSYGTKMAIEGLVRQLATELGPSGIRVNGLSPGLIDVGREQTAEWQQIEEKVIEATALRRLGTVEEMADVCCFLASDHASFVTGQVLHANGGTYPIPNLLPTE